MAEFSGKMKLIIALVIVATLIGAAYLAQMSTKPNIVEQEPEQTINPIAVVNTTMGEFRIELFEKEFKKDKEYDSVRLTDNFKRYAASGFYDGVVIHGIAPWPYNKTRTLIYTGEYTSDLSKKELPFAPIKYGRRTDVDFGFKHTDLMVSWFETWNITSIFYICNGDFSGDSPESPTLDPKDPVFGKVISGADVIRSMGALPTHYAGPDFPNLPNETVMIKHVYVFYPDAEEHLEISTNFDIIEMESDRALLTRYRNPFPGLSLHLPL